MRRRVFAGTRAVFGAVLSAGLFAGLSGCVTQQVAAPAPAAGQWHSVAVPLRYEIGRHEIVASGEFPLRQTDLGLTPFSAAAGALRVRDGMTVSLRLVARPRG